MRKLPHPWDMVEWERVRFAFQRSLTGHRRLAGGKGHLWYVRAPKEFDEGRYAPSLGLGVSRLLILGLPDEVRTFEDEDVEDEELRDMLEVLDSRSWTRTDVLLAGLEECELRRFDGDWLVYASNPSSRCSGSWGVSVSFGEKRCYFFSSEEDINEGNFGDTEYLIAVCEPAEPDVFREACIRAYGYLYRELTLPPQMGEQADGSQPLWMECLEELFRSNKEARGEMLDQMPALDSVGKKRWESVRELTGLDPRELLEYYRREGLEPHAGTGQRKAARPPLHRVRESPRLNEEELLQDPKLLRFWIANYCYALGNANTLWKNRSEDD